MGLGWSQSNLMLLSPAGWKVELGQKWLHCEKFSCLPKGNVLVGGG